MGRLMAVLGALIVSGLWLGPAVADEVKTPVSASMMLNILSAPSEPRDTAYDRSIKEEGPAPRSPFGEVQPDGSVKYGSVSVTVRNPCPPGTAHYLPPPLPGRRARN